MHGFCWRENCIYPWCSKCNMFLISGLMNQGTKKREAPSSNHNPLQQKHSEQNILEQEGFTSILDSHHANSRNLMASGSKRIHAHQQITNCPGTVSGPSFAEA